MNQLHEYREKLEFTAYNVITNYYIPHFGSTGEALRAFERICDLSNNVVRLILHDAENPNDFLDEIRRNNLIAEPLKYRLIDALKQVFESSLCRPPTDKELLEFLQEGDDNQ